MAKHFFRSNTLYEQSQVNVDRDNRTIRNIVLANRGLNKNNTYFSDRFLTELLSYGNQSQKGIKARFGHPNMCSTSFGSYIGRYQNFKLDNGKLYGDLVLDPITQKTTVEGRGITMFNYIFEMAESNPDMFGNSIHISCQDVEETYEEGGETKKATGHQLSQWIASDLVDDPAATENLFFATEDLGVKVTEFLDASPEIFEAVDKNPNILSDFFERYENYSALLNYYIQFVV